MLFQDRTPGSFRVRGRWFQVAQSRSRWDGRPCTCGRRRAQQSIIIRRNCSTSVARPRTSRMPSGSDVTPARNPVSNGKSGAKASATAAVQLEPIAQSVPKTLNPQRPWQAPRNEPDASSNICSTQSGSPSGRSIEVTNRSEPSSHCSPDSCRPSKPISQPIAVAPGSICSVSVDSACVAL